MPGFSNLLMRALNGGGSKFDNARQHHHSVEVKVQNLPSNNILVDKLNGLLVNSQISKVRSDVAITFVPSCSLKDVFAKYKKLIYYCVHDSVQQSYGMRHKRYEKELVNRANIVLCDNLTVLDRLAGNNNIVDVASSSMTEINIAMKEKKRFFYISPPTPTVFFEVDLNFDCFDYDFFYFGSLHRDIDYHCIEKLCDYGYKIAIMSSEKLPFENDNIIYLRPSPDMKTIVDNAKRSKAILLPYSNSKFMDTVSPAKINQSLATGKIVYSSNSRLSSMESIFDIRSILHDSGCIKNLTRQFSIEQRELVKNTESTNVLSKLVNIVSHEQSI
jgi:hypothetical protein